MKIKVLNSVSLFCLFYVAFMVLNFYIFRLKIVILDAIMNFMTIPSLLFVWSAFIISLIKIWKKQRGFYLIFILNLFSLLLIIFATVFEELQ